MTLWDSFRWRPDEELVRENYGAIARWADYLLSRLDNGLVRFPEGDPIDCLGDWATPEGGDWGGSENAVFFHQCAAVLSLGIAAQFASLLGKAEDAPARKRYLDGGSAGTVFLFRAIGEILRRPDLLYEKLLSRSYPGYGYFLEKDL